MSLMSIITVKTTLKENYVSDNEEKSNKETFW